MYIYVEDKQIGKNLDHIYIWTESFFDKFQSPTFLKCYSVLILYITLNIKKGYLAF